MLTIALLEEDVDDLLDFIEGTSKNNPKRTDSSHKHATWSAGKTEDNKSKAPSTFFDALIDNDNDDSLANDSSYIPSMSQNRQPRSNKLSNEAKSKMGQLFGIKSDVKSPENSAKGNVQRPFTSEPRTNTAAASKQPFNQTGFSDSAGIGGDSGINELSMPFSRRAKSNRTLRDRESHRPYTSPVGMGGDQKEDDVSRAGTQDNMSMQGAYDTASNYDPKSTHHLKDDGEDDRQSEYVPSGLSRPATRGGRPEEKKSTKNILDTDFGSGLGGGFTKKLPISNIADDRSDTHSVITQKQHGGDTTTANASTNYPGDTTGLFKKNLNSSDISDQRKPPLSKFEEKMANIMRGGTGGGSSIPQANPRTELSIPAFEDGVSRQGFGGQDKSFLGEETIKKVLKDTEDYYKGALEDLKKHHREEKEKWEAAHAKEVELLKKEKSMLLEQMEVSLQRERDRLKELHQLELQSKDKMHSYELERQKHLLEEQAESLKKQLEAQIKLNALAEEVRLSSNKLQTLSDKIDAEKRFDDNSKKRELDERERLTEEREMKIKADLDILEREKQRYDRLLMDLDEKENEAMRKIDREKTLVAQEYRRLSELQESLKQAELEKRRELTNEKAQLENLRVKLEKESLEIKEEYRKKYADLEIQISLFEEQKKEFLRQHSEDEKILRRKIDEADALRKKIAQEESELLKKLKNAEIRELQLVKMTDELQTKLDLLNMERSTFEQEKLKVHEIAKRASEEMEFVNKFKMEFDMEKEKNHRMKIELDSYATTLQKERLKIDEEKASLTLLQKTLEGMRYGYVKELSTGGGTTTQGVSGKPPVSNLRATATAGFPMKGNDSDAPHQRSGSVGLTHADSGKNFNETAGAIGPGGDRSFSRGRERSEGKRPSLNKSFDLGSYMEQLKHLDKSSSVHNDYILKEKENLIRNKINIETGHLYKPRRDSRDGNLSFY